MGLSPLSGAISPVGQTLKLHPSSGVISPIRGVPPLPVMMANAQRHGLPQHGGSPDVRRALPRQRKAASVSTELCTMAAVVQANRTPAALCPRPQATHPIELATRVRALHCCSSARPNSSLPVKQKKKLGHPLTGVWGMKKKMKFEHRRKSSQNVVSKKEKRKR